MSNFLNCSPSFVACSRSKSPFPKSKRQPSGKRRLVLQALVLASSVQMTHHALGNTPAIITPPVVSPASSNEPGATPMQVGVLLHCQ